MKKILIINPFGIGDVLFTTPVIAALKKELNSSFIGYWSNLRVSQILEDNPNIDRIFALSRGDLKKSFASSLFKGLGDFSGLFRRIRSEKFDTAFDYSLDHRYGLICKLAGIKERIGFDYKGRGRFLTIKVPCTGYHQKHAVEYYLELLKAAGLQRQANNLELFVSKEARCGLRQILERHSVSDKDCLIAFAPFGGESWGNDAFRKHWPGEYYCELIKMLTERLKAKALILADASEQSLAEKYFSNLKSQIIDLSGQISLKELAAVIERCSLLVTNDGGPLHMATALGKRTLSFFGPTDSLVYGPYSTEMLNHVILKYAVDCQPCYKGFRLNKCLRDKECLRQIRPEEAFAAVEMLIKD